ncbi:hypothetical protein K438DRAFT_1168286 [Mycena galopus ATCC 62051]|nr:hypothetical protein K438DRAFT_1168286 [Mycena galopus ATCC 62051]
MSSSSSQRLSASAASSSSRVTSSLLPTSSRAPSSSSKIPISSSTQLQSTSAPLSITHLPSVSISQSSSSLNPTPTAVTDAQVAPLAHRTGVIAAICASIIAALLTALIVFFLCRRRRIRQRQLASSTSEQHHFMHELPTPREEDAPWRDTPPSTAGSGWPENANGSPWTAPGPPSVGRDRRSMKSIASFSGKTPHYTTRSRASASMSEVYGFGQDLAWREAHYEHPLPTNPSGSTPMRPQIDVSPPTPVLHHTTGSALPLVRNPSTASSINSEYSTASAGRSAPRDTIQDHQRNMSYQGQESRPGFF